MRTILSKTPLIAVVTAFFASAKPAEAVSTSLNGVYSGPGTSTQVLVFRGRPVSNAILNNHQEFSRNFITATESANPGGLRIDYSFEETRGQSTFTVRYFKADDGTLLLTFTSIIKVNVVLDTNTTFRTSTEWTMKMWSEFLSDFPLSSQTITEEYQFNLANFTCVYTFNSGGSVTLTRINSGTGGAQGSPLVPRNPVWSRSTPLNFPVISPNSTIWCDPPFASSFEYTVAAGRKERMATLTLPKGFGNQIRVLAEPSAGGPVKLVGSFKSGAKINLLKRPGLAKGTKKLVIRGIKPKVDIKKKAPYPVGLTFTNLQESAVKLKIQAKEISKTR